ncbi:MAG: hypothetical protein V1930_05880 [Pseudomonadota bacterium]
MVLGMPTFIHNANSFNKKDLVLCTLLVSFCIFLFKEIIIGGHLLFGSDFAAFYLGLKQFLYNEIHTRHSIPFWNPYVFSGMPFWAHFESTIFYPLDILFWIIPAEKAYGYTMFIHLSLAALFMYLFARSLRIGPIGSLLAALVFTSNGFIMPTLFDGQMFRVQGYIWIPLILYFLHRASNSRRPYFHASFAGLFLGIQILSGSPQDALYTFLASLLFLGSACRSPLGDGLTPAKALVMSGILVGIGSGVAAIQIIPALEFVNLSVRSVLDSYELVTDGSYPPQAIITTLMPHFFGNYVEGNFWVADLPWSVPLYNLYVGILPLILLPFISYKGSEDRKGILFGTILAIMALLLAMGSHTPIYRLLYHLPGFDRIRAPSKIIVLWVFALGLLAGRGLDDLFRRPKESLLRPRNVLLCLVLALVLLDLIFQMDRSLILKFLSPFILEQAIPERMADAAEILCHEFHRLTLFSALIIFSILLWIRRPVSYRLLQGALCLFLLVDLGYVNKGAVQHNDMVYGWAKKARKDLKMTLGKDKSLYRVGSYRFGMGPNIEMVLGYQTVGGYNPLFLYRYYEYINRYRYDNKEIPKGWIVFFYEPSGNTRLMDLLNVKYVISHATRQVALRKTFLPRAFMVPGHKFINKAEVLDYLLRPDFDPTRTVLFEKGEFVPETPGFVHQDADWAAQAGIVSYEPDQMVIETHSTRPGYLFLSEIFYPGWKAFVDDKPQRILRGDSLFRVVEIPKGNHSVYMVFNPVSIKVGIGITVLTLFLFLNILVYHFIKKRKGVPS